MSYYPSRSPYFKMVPPDSAPTTRAYDAYVVNSSPALPIPSLKPSGAVESPSLPLSPRHSASLGAWSQEDDRALLQLRAMGKNWNQIQREAFPTKTGNACRKRHERLMERRAQNEYDNRKSEQIAKEYMSMRKEIWQPLAQRCGEKWNVVEMQCMSNGLKNIQAHARAYARRERLESGQPLTGYDDDSGISGMGLTPIDDVPEESYSTPGASNADSPEPSAGLHDTSFPADSAYSKYSHHNSASMGPYMGHSNRLPIVEKMGIESLINRGNPWAMTEEHSAKDDGKNVADSTHDIAEMPNISLQPPFATRDLGASSTTLDPVFESTPNQPNSPQAPATPAAECPQAVETAASPDIDETSDSPEGSTPSSVRTINMSSSSSFLGSSVSDASTGISYSFIRPQGHPRGTLDCVVQWVEQWIDQQFQGFVRGCCCSGAQNAGGPPPNSDNTHTNNRSSKADASQKAKGKRPADDDLPNDDSEDDSRRDPKRPKPDSPDFSSQRRFACPFFKRNPTRYQEVRPCFGPGFKSIHRLKEHLFRKHALPKYKCPRCCMSFQNEDELHAHHRSEVPCSLVSEAPPEGINEGQLHQLRKRCNTAKDEHQRWIDVYRILFPDDDPSSIPSPYYENTLVQHWQLPPQCSHQEMFSRLKTFLRRYACQRLHEALEDFEPEFRTMLNDKLKEKLSEVLPKLQLDLIEDFRQQEVTDPTPQLDPGGTSETNYDNCPAAEQHDSQRQQESLGIESLPIAFLEGLDFSLLEPDFDVLVDMPGSFDGIFGGSGSSATYDLESTEGPEKPMVLGKTQDSGYGSTDGIAGPQELQRGIPQDEY